MLLHMQVENKEQMVNVTGTVITVIACEPDLNFILELVTVTYFPRRLMNLQFHNLCNTEIHVLLWRIQVLMHISPPTFSEFLFSHTSSEI